MQFLLSLLKKLNFDHQELLEAAADCDDDLMEKVLMEEEVSVEELKAAIRKGVISCKLNPVFVGSAYKNKGVQELLRCCC